jgi:transmembrane sensor
MSDPEKTLKDAAHWFAVLHRNVTTLEERAAFDQWHADHDHRSALARMERAWQSAGLLTRQTMEDGTSDDVPRSRRGLLRAGMMAGLAASITVGTFSARNGKWLSRPDWDGQMETGVGEQREITLPDGSVIHLNVMTRVKWRVTSLERKVLLESGDALFTVAKNPEKPFAVLAAGARVTVLGTIFSVSLRDQVIGVMVREGHVAFTPQPSEKVQLFAGQSVMFTGHALGPVTVVAPDQVGEWCDHFVTFEKTALRDVVRELGRYFPMLVRVEPAVAANRLITLRLKLHDENSTIELLSQLLSAKIERKTSGEMVIHMPS